MNTRRNFIKGLFGFASVCLATVGFKTVSGESEKSKSNNYILDPKTGLPKLTDGNLNLMVNRQMTQSKLDYEAGWEAGVAVAISAGKHGPCLGWKCYVESLHHPFRHFQTGMVGSINFKDKTIDIMVLDEYPITDSRSSLRREKIK